MYRSVHAGEMCVNSVTERSMLTEIGRIAHSSATLRDGISRQT